MNADELPVDVSRETADKLKLLNSELGRWNKAINLVSPSTVASSWARHISDSAQLATHIPTATISLCDIGSGGGFPGLVLALVMAETHPQAQVTMIESDGRKCAFLQSMSQKLEIKTLVRVERIEAAPPQNADVVTARALAPLPKLLGYAHRHLRLGGTGLFLKGSSADQETQEALASWRFELTKRESQTSADASILEITHLRPA